MAKTNTTRITSESQDALDEVSTAIAKLHWDNWDIVTRYQWIRNEADRIEHEAKKKYGDFAAPHVLKKAIQKQLDNLMQLNAPRNLGGKPKQRMGPQQKLDVLLAMLRDFKRNKTKEISLKDINAWFGAKRKQGEEDIRDQYGLRNMKITQTQWFAVKAGEKKIPLYQKTHYVTKKAPFPSYFVVDTWLKWLEQNEEKLSKTIRKEQRRGS